MNNDHSLDCSEYADMCDNANDLIQSVTLEGHYRYVNQAWIKALGYTPDELASITIFDTIHPDELAHCRELFGKVMSGEDIGLVKTRFVARNGTVIYVEGNVNCQHVDGIPTYTRAIFRDVTRSVQNERVIERLYQQEKRLRESLEAENIRKTEFSRILVHELKTPLVSIMGVAELMKDSNLKPPFDRAVASLTRSSKELNERITELLELTKSEAGTLSFKPRTISSVRLIREVVRDIRPLARAKRLKLTIDIPGDLSPVKADKKRIRQVLQNIIDNAIKATPENGTITVRAIEDKHDVAVLVQDSGPGISEQDRQRVFDPYFRAPGIAKGYSGLGLGLTLSKRIVETHGGHIRVESKPGRGATFSFTLPKA